MDEKQKQIDGYLRVYRERIKRAKITGEEFLDDLLVYLEKVGLEITMKEKKNG